MRRIFPGLLTILALAIAVGFYAWPGDNAEAGADLIVTRTDDPAPDGCAPGDCSLREALLAVGGEPTASPTITPSPSPMPTVTPSPSPTPTPLPTGQVVNGDANCNGSVNMDDVMLILEHLAGVGGLPAPQGVCAPLGGGVPGESGADADCDGGVDAHDALRILLAQVGGDVPSPPSQCPAVGQPKGISANGSESASGGVVPAGGPVTIGFNIPGEGANGYHVIRPTSALPAIGLAGVTIDGYTQPGSSPNNAIGWTSGNAVIKVVLDGSDIQTGAEFGLWVGAGNATIRGLSIVNFGDEGIKTGTFPTSATIAGNYIGVLPDGTAAPNRVGVSIRSSQQGNLVGGASSADRNVISANVEDGLHLWGSTPVLVHNNFIGSDPSGMLDRGNGQYGIHVAGATGSAIGGTGGGNLVSGNGSHGIYASATNNLFIAGNKVGTNALGTAALPNGGDGIHLAGGSTGTIGGSSAPAANIASGNGGSGITLTLDAHHHNVKGNLVGVQADGVTALGNSGHGVFLGSLAHDNTIGGEFNTGEQNVIAFNGMAGVALANNAGINNYIDPSKTYSNVGLGTDLLADNQVLPNDATDSDSGPNSLMNYPVVSTATYTGGTLHLEASLTSLPDFYNVFVFLNHGCDPSGYGEGERFLSPSVPVIIGGAGGTTAFTKDYPVDLQGATHVTMSASDPESTSEFSQCRQIVVTP